MKCFFIPCLLGMSIVAFAQNAKDPTFEQKQALFMINYAQYSAYKLKTYNNILALEDEYRTLNNNMNLELIQDYSSVVTITELMDAIHNERKNNKNIARLKTSVEKRMNQAVYNMLPQISSIISVGSMNPYVLALNVAQTAGSMYMNYTQYKNELSQEYDDKMWEYEQISLDILNTISKNLLTYSYTLMQEYGISDNWRITEVELEKLFNCLKDADKNRVYKNLQYLETDRFYEHFPMFWYHIGVAAAELDDDENAVRYFTRFEKENLPIFRYDVTAVSAYKGLISIYLENPAKYKSQILKYLKFIESNKTTWNDFYFCALAYQTLGDTINAKRLLDRNISELSAAVETQLIDINHLSEIATAKIQPGTTAYDGLSISRALLNTLDKGTSSVNSVIAQYKKDTAAFNEVLYWFGLQPSEHVVNNSLEDLKKITLTLRRNSPKEVLVTCTLPALWMLSANTGLQFINSDDEGTNSVHDLKLSEKAMKKRKGTEIGQTQLVYTVVAKARSDYKSKKYFLYLNHPQYPVLLTYNIEDIKKANKNVLPSSVTFNDKTYALNSNEQIEGSWINTVVDPVKNLGGNAVDTVKNLWDGIFNRAEKPDEESK